MQVDGCRGLCIDASRVHDFHGSADNPSQNGTLRHSDIKLVLSHRAQERVDKYRATRPRICAAPSSPRLSQRPAASMGNSSACCISLPTTRLSFTSERWMRPSMSILKPTAGGGAGFPGACGLPSAWCALRPLPCALRFSAKPTRGPDLGAHAQLGGYTDEVTVTSGLHALSRAGRPLRSLRLHPPRLCRFAAQDRLGGSGRASVRTSGEYTSPLGLRDQKHMINTHTHM